VNTAVVAITRHGIAQAGRIVAALPGSRLLAPESFAAEAEAAAPGRVRRYAGKLADEMAALVATHDAIVAVVSLGAVVRLLAPHLRGKDRDPAVVVIDEAGRFAIPALSGHAGGANALALRLATALGATPVLTTASDARQTLAVDLLGREHGWRIEAGHDELVRASAAMVNDAPVALVQEAGESDWWTRHANGRDGPLPANLDVLAGIGEADPERYAALLWVSRQPLPEALATVWAGRLVVYRPDGGIDSCIAN